MKIPHEWHSRRWEFFLTTNALSWVENWKVPEMYLLWLVKNFQLLHSQLWPPHGGIIPFPQIGGEIGNQLFLHIKMMVLSFICKLLAWLLPKSATRSCCGAMKPTNCLWFCTKIPNFWGNTAYLRFSDNLNLGKAGGLMPRKCQIYFLCSLTANF